MNQKNILIIIVLAIALAVIGYFFFLGDKTGEQVPVSSQGKININEVCEGALVYMTFSDGASADKFVAECKEGKHPEVIERFKAQLNLSADVAI